MIQALRNQAIKLLVANECKHISSEEIDENIWELELFLIQWTVNSEQLLLGEGNGTPLQYSCLENPMDKRSLVGCSPQGR